MTISSSSSERTSGQPASPRWTAGLSTSGNQPGSPGSHRTPSCRLARRGRLRACRKRAPVNSYGSLPPRAGRPSIRYGGSTGRGGSSGSTPFAAWHSTHLTLPGGAVDRQRGIDPSVWSRSSISSNSASAASAASPMDASTASPRMRRMGSSTAYSSTRGDPGVRKRRRLSSLLTTLYTCKGT